MCIRDRHLNSTRIVKRSPFDLYDLSFAEREARRQMFELYTFLKENCEGFANSTLLSSAPEISVRESRMIDGVYTLTVTAVSYTHLFKVVLSGKVLKPCSSRDFKSICLPAYRSLYVPPESEASGRMCTVSATIPRTKSAVLLTAL